MGQLQTLSDSLERARSQYDSATQQLAKIQASIRENRYELHVAKHNLKVSQRTIEQRVVDLYTSDQESTLEVILGSRNLDDMITRIDSAKSVNGSTRSVLQQVKTVPHGREATAERFSRTHTTRRCGSSPSAPPRSTRSSRRSASSSGCSRRSRARSSSWSRSSTRGSCSWRRKRRRACSTGAGSAGAAAEHDHRRHHRVRRRSPTRSSRRRRRTATSCSIALSQLGTPYVWGGAAPGGFDCSGLVMWAYAQVGVSLPHSSYALWNYGVPVSRGPARAGRHRVLRRARPRRHLHRRRRVRPGAAHRRRRARSPASTSGWYAATYVGARRIL